MKRAKSVVKSDPLIITGRKAFVIRDKMNRKLLSNIKLFWQATSERTNRKLSLLRVVM